MFFFMYNNLGVIVPNANVGTTMVTTTLQRLSSAWCTHTRMTALSPSTLLHREKLGMIHVLLSVGLISWDFSFSVEYLWELTTEIVCYKANFSALAKKFDLMHTGEIIKQHRMIDSWFMLGHISDKELRDAKTEQAVLKVHEKVEFSSMRPGWLWNCHWLWWQYEI